MCLIHCIIVFPLRLLWGFLVLNISIHRGTLEPWLTGGRPKLKGGTSNFSSHSWTSPSPLFKENEVSEKWQKQKAWDLRLLIKKGVGKSRDLIKRRDAWFFGCVGYNDSTPKLKLILKDYYFSHFRACRFQNFLLPANHGVNNTFNYTFNNCILLALLIMIMMIMIMVMMVMMTVFRVWAMCMSLILGDGQNFKRVNVKKPGSDSSAHYASCHEYWSPNGLSFSKPKSLTTISGRGLKSWLFKNISEPAFMHLT